MKKHKKLSNNAPIHNYINRINNRLVFRIKYGYNFALEILEIPNYLVAQKS